MTQPVAPSYFGFTPTAPSGSSAPVYNIAPQAIGAGGNDFAGSNLNADLAGVRRIGTYDSFGSPDPAEAAVTGKAPYKDYQALGTVAQQYGQQAQTTLNDPRVQQALSAQQSAVDPTQYQQSSAANFANLGRGMSGGQSVQNDALGILQQQAQGGGPSAGTQQLQQGLQQGQAAQQALAASAHGGALANAGLNAANNSATMAQQANLQGQQIRAQEQAAAQNAYAAATQTAAQQNATNAGNFATNANQARLYQSQNLQQYSQNAQAQQAALEQYYLGQQGAYGQQQQLAGNMATGIGNLAVGQAAQASQMQIAQQQNTMNYLGAGLSAGGAILDTGMRGAGGGGGGSQ